MLPIPARRARAWRALAPLLLLAAPRALAAQTPPLCTTDAPVLLPRLTALVEVGAGANAARSARGPWRFEPRAALLYSVSRTRGLAVGPVLGYQTSQPAAAVLGGRVEWQPKSLVQLTSIALPGAGLRFSGEYAYLLGADRTHRVAAGVALDLVDLARLGVRGAYIAPYTGAGGRVPRQWVVEFAIGRSFTIGGRRALANGATEAPVLGSEAYEMGLVLAKGALERVRADDGTSQRQRCAPAQLAALRRVAREGDALRTRAELVAALRAAGVDDVSVRRYDTEFPDQDPPAEADRVRELVRALRDVLEGRGGGRP